MNDYSFYHRSWLNSFFLYHISKWKLKWQLSQTKPRNIYNETFNTDKIFYLQKETSILQYTTGRNAYFIVCSYLDFIYNLKRKRNKCVVSRSQVKNKIREFFV